MPGTFTGRAGRVFGYSHEEKRVVRFPQTIYGVLSHCKDFHPKTLAVLMYLTYLLRLTE